MFAIFIYIHLMVNIKKRAGPKDLDTSQFFLQEHNISSRTENDIRNSSIHLPRIYLLLIFIFNCMACHFTTKRVLSITYD